MDLINKNIRMLRKLENIKSQGEFGKILNVPSHNINKYENGVIPKPDVIRTIANKFNINLHLFLTKELIESNYEDFKIEQDTEIKLQGLVNEVASNFEIKRNDVDRFATFFADKLARLEIGDINDIDRKKIFSDLRSIFVAYNLKLKEFYDMQDRLSIILEGKSPPSS